jgi:hypothetical protein
MENAPELPMSILSSPNEIDWKYFLELMGYHRVDPLVYFNIKKWSISKYVPSEVLDALYLGCNRNTFQMLHLSAEMERVCRVLSENQIRTLMLKGPVLAKYLYGDISLRTSKDLDILVPVDEVEMVEILLLNLGYVIIDDKPHILNEWKWRDHHSSYFHPQKNIQVEIHWRLHPDYGLEPSFDEMWRRRNVSELTDFPIHFLGNEDLFFYLITHGFRHGWFRLRWLFDIDKLMRMNLDWNHISQQLKEYESFPIGGQAVILASQLFRTPIQQELEPWTIDKQAIRMARDVTVLFIGRKPVNNSLDKYYRRTLFSMKSTSQKWRYIINRLRPSSLDAAALPLPESLHFLYFPLRPILWLWRRMQRSTETRGG